MQPEEQSVELQGTYAYVHTAIGVLHRRIRKLFVYLIPFHEVPRTLPPGVFKPYREPSNLLPVFSSAFLQRRRDRAQKCWLDFLGQLDDIVVFHIWPELRNSAPFVPQAPVVHIHKNKAVSSILCGLLMERMQNLG